MTGRIWNNLLCSVRYALLISCVPGHFWGFLLPYLSSLPLSSCKFWTSSGRVILCSPVSWLLFSPILLTWPDIPRFLNWLFLLYFWCQMFKPEDYIPESCWGRQEGYVSVWPRTNTPHQCKGLEYSHPLPPSSPTPHTPRVGITMNSLKQGLLPVLFSKIFWSFLTCQSYICLVIFPVALAFDSFCLGHSPQVEWIIPWSTLSFPLFCRVSFYFITSNKELWLAIQAWYGTPLTNWIQECFLLLQMLTWKDGIWKGNR